MYQNPWRRYARHAGAARARDVPVDAHQGSHGDFLLRYRHAAQEAAQKTSRERREFAHCLIALKLILRYIQHLT